MNYGMVIYILGWILKIESVMLLLPCIVAVIYRESAGISFLITAVIALVIGTLMSLRKPTRTKVYGRDGFVTVALAWLVMSLIGGLPFTLNGDIPSYLDAVFETVSGFTTTGASILTAVEPLNKCSLFWRSFTHWVGGMGIFVFMLAVVPLLGGSTFNLMKAESPGPVVGKFVPRVGDTAKILYTIYFIITVTEFILLAAFGMPVFEALCHTFGTVGTGGFGVKNDSYMSYSASLQIITTVFMIACGINFQFYFYLVAKKLKLAFGMTEVRAYISLVLISIVIITINISGMYGFGESLRHAAFQVGTIITTTGYATADFDKWPELTKTLLVLLMIIGACAGSTGGGMKVSRVLIMFKTVFREIRKYLHPRAVTNVTMDGKTLDRSTLHSVSVYLSTYMFIFVFSMLAITMIENHLDLETVFTSVACTFNNIGPGLSKVGPTCNFNMMQPVTKYILMFDMLAGRLELYPMLMLLTPAVWKKGF